MLVPKSQLSLLSLILGMLRRLVDQRMVLRIHALPRVGIFAVSLGIVLTIRTAGHSTETSTNASADSQQAFAASLTVIPPVAISDQVEFEVRVAVRNRGLTTAGFELTLNIEHPGGAPIPLYATPLEVKPHAQHLVTKRFPSKPHVGKNKITFRLSGPSGKELSGESGLEVIKCETRAIPLLQIGWIDPGAVIGIESKRKVTDSDLRAAIDAYAATGIKGLIITYPEVVFSGGPFYYPSKVFSEYGMQSKLDIVGTILNQASKNGQHVFVGLGRGPDLLLTWTGFDDPNRRQAAMAHSTKVATELWTMYSHEPSFYGWYLTHEANDIAAASRGYYNPITDFLRTFEADKPVLVSPAGTPIISTDILAASKVDIFAYQDAVGSGYVPYKNTFDPEQRIQTLDDVYASYQKAHEKSGKHLWTNLEIWQMKGPEYGFSFPPTFDRVHRQLEFQKKYVDIVTSYELTGFMHPESIRTDSNDPAAELFQAYQKYYERTTQQLRTVRP